MYSSFISEGKCIFVYFCFCHWKILFHLFLFYFTYFSIGFFVFIDLLELSILRLLILCRMYWKLFSLVCHLFLCSFKYFNLYFMESRIYGLLRKAFLFQNYKAVFFCSLSHSWINLFAFVALIHLDFITEFEVRICILFLNAEPTVLDCLLNNLFISSWEWPSHYYYFLYTMYRLFSHLCYSTYTLGPLVVFQEYLERTTFEITLGIRWELSFVHYSVSSLF